MLLSKKPTLAVEDGHEEPCSFWERFFLTRAVLDWLELGTRERDLIIIYFLYFRFDCFAWFTKFFRFYFSIPVSTRIG